MKIIETVVTVKSCPVETVYLIVRDTEIIEVYWSLATALEEAQHFEGATVIEREVLI